LGFLPFFFVSDVTCPLDVRWVCPIFFSSLSFGRSLGLPIWRVPCLGLGRVGSGSNKSRITRPIQYHPFGRSGIGPRLAWSVRWDSYLFSFSPLSRTFVGPTLSRTFVGPIFSFFLTYPRLVLRFGPLLGESLTVKPSGWGRRGHPSFFPPL